MTGLELILRALAEGGQYTLALLGWAAWWYERRTNRETNGKLIELATAQIEASLKHEQAIANNTKLMERIMDR